MFQYIDVDEGRDAGVVSARLVIPIALSMEDLATVSGVSFLAWTCESKMRDPSLRSG